MRLNDEQFQVTRKICKNINLSNSREGRDKNTNFNLNLNINSREENFFRDKSQYNLRLSSHIINKLRKKSRYFKYLKKEYLLYISNALYKNKS